MKPDCQQVVQISDRFPSKLPSAEHLSQAWMKIELYANPIRDTVLTERYIVVLTKTSQQGESKQRLQ